MDEEFRENSATENTSESNSASDLSGHTTDSYNKTMESSVALSNILLQEIKVLIQDRLQYDLVKEAAFDKLYEELKRQKEIAESLDRVLKPIFSDLLLLHDSITKLKVSFVNNLMNNEDAVKGIEYLKEELLEILYRQDVLPIEENNSSLFNSKIQKAIKTEKAYLKDDDFRIADIVRSGFMWREKVLRPQDVVIMRFVESI